MRREERKKYRGAFRLDGTQYFDPPSALIEGIVPNDEITVLSGQPKVGKSTFGSHLSYAVATGEDFLGRKVNSTGEVIYIAMERAYQTQSRLYKLFDLGEQTPRNITIIRPQECELGSLFFDDNDQVSAFIDYLETMGFDQPALLVIDSLTNTLLGRDSESRDMNTWFNGVQRVTDYFSMPALALHHDTKDGDSYRGSTAILARSGAWLRATTTSKKGIKLTVERSNFKYEWTEYVQFNDFGLYEQSMPNLSKDKKPILKDFVAARLAENQMVTSTDLLKIIQKHGDTQWPDLSAAELSQAVSALGTQVVKHPNPKDGRSKFLELV